MAGPMETNKPRDGLAGDAAEALARLRDLFNTQAIKPGERLPPERRLAASIGVGRGSVRRALAKLDEEGLIWRHVGQGTFFTGSQTAKLAGNLAATVSPVEILDMRLMIEPAMACLAAVRATAEDTKHLTHCLERSRAATNARTFEHWDAALHRAVALATHNTVAVAFCDVLAAIQLRPDWMRLKRRSLTPARRLHYAHQHAKIVHAIAARDAAAARSATQEHIETVRDNLFQDTD